MEDTAPWVYDFRYNYYENFYANRQKQMATSGSFYDMYKSGWSDFDETIEIDGVLVNNGIDIKSYIQATYNGDTPECLTDKVVDSVKQVTEGIVGWVLNPYNAIFNAIISFFKDLSFICTATVNTLGIQCGHRLLDELKDYRDTVTMMTPEGRAMIRYYGVIGPKIVAAIDCDTDKDIVYKYLYAEYVSKLSKLIHENKHEELMSTYFQLLDDMIARYSIDVTERYKTWALHSTH